jgi:hypothetical protein
VPSRPSSCRALADGTESANYQTLSSTAASAALTASLAASFLSKSPDAIGNPEKLYTRLKEHAHRDWIIGIPSPCTPNLVAHNDTTD